MQRFLSFLPIYNKFKNKQVMAMKTQKFKWYKFNCPRLYCLSSFSTVYFGYPGLHERSLNDRKPIKNGVFSNDRYFSYTNICQQYRYGYITEHFTDRLPNTIYRPLTNTVYAPFFQK